MLGEEGGDGVVEIGRLIGERGRCAEGKASEGKSGDAAEKHAEANTSAAGECEATGIAKPAGSGGMANVARWLYGIAILLAALPSLADGPVHGMWVWKTASVLETPGSAEALRDFCKSADVNEVYVSFSSKEGMEARLVNLIAVLHRADVRAEALFGNADGDKPGKPRDALLELVRGVVAFNDRHPKERFDGIHLDVEPHQREENKGVGNLRFLPDLIETFRAARGIAEPAGMNLNVDVPNKVLKADAEQRKALLKSTPRVTLMLYELSKPGDPKAAEKVRRASERYLAMTYEALENEPGLATLAIALRTPDYEKRLPEMLKGLDEAYAQNPHYLGWARHSYNDAVGR
jgi:hypothetical protein